MLRRRRVIRGGFGERRPRPVVSPDAVLPAKVVAFDAAVGLGVLELEGGQLVDFHCIVVDDGTRSVDVGQRVLVRVAAAYRGALEATWIHKLRGRSA